MRKKEVRPEPLLGDEIQSVIDAEPIPRGTKEIVVHVAPPTSTKPHTCGITTFEQAIPFVQGLAEFNFDDPRGLEGVRGEPWKNYHAVLLESVDEDAVAYQLYADIGARIGNDHLTRKSAPLEKLKSAIVKYVDRNADLMKPGFQFRITSDWQITPIVPLERKESRATVAQLCAGIGA